MPYPGQFAWSPLDEYREPVAGPRKPFVRKYSLLPGQIDIAALAGANPLAAPVMASGPGNPVSQGNHVVTDAVVRADGGNNMAAQAGTASSKPVTPLAATPEEDFEARRSDVIDYVPPTPTSHIRFQTGTGRGSANPLAPSRTAPAIFQDSNAVMGPVPQDERTYGGERWSNYAATSGSQRLIDNALRDENMARANEEELAPFQLAAAKAALTQKAESPDAANTREQRAFEAFRAGVPPSYIAGKKAEYRALAARDKIVFTEEEMNQMAMSDYAEEFGIFQRNRMGRYPVPDPFAAAMLAGND